MRPLPGIAAVSGMCVLVAACPAPTHKLDEVTFYEGPDFKLKLVRYYENLRFHYTGEVFYVQCASARTAGSPGSVEQDPGWVTLANGGAIGSHSAAELVERERHNYLVIDDHTLVWTGTGLHVSFAGCSDVRAWYPTSLPVELIDPVAKPSYCAPQGASDCRNLDFEGDRRLRFEEVHVEPDGHISFSAHSRAFKGTGAVRVRSTDFGRTWSYDPL